MAELPNVENISKDTGLGNGPMKDVKGLTLHYTGPVNEKAMKEKKEPARHYDLKHYLGGAKNSGSGAQFYLERDFTDASGVKHPAKVYQVAPDGTKMFHTKSGRVNGFDCNNNVLQGIEINAFNERDITPGMWKVLRSFVTEHCKKNGYDPRHVFGHGEIDPARRGKEMIYAAKAIRNGDEDFFNCVGKIFNDMISDAEKAIEHVVQAILHPKHSGSRHDRSRHRPLRDHHPSDRHNSLKHRAPHTGGHRGHRRAELPSFVGQA